MSQCFLGYSEAKETKVNMPRIDDYGFKPYLERIESATKKLEEDITRIEGIVEKADNLESTPSLHL